MLGVVDDLLVDRAFIEQRRDSALELASVADVNPAAPHNVANALAAAALARAFGVPATAVRDGLRGVRLGAHKIETVLVRDGVTFVDDSKATNPHAADAALRAFASVVWIAGGQAKGTTFDDLVVAHRDRLRGAVLLGVDRAVIADALSRHAPDVPVITIEAVRRWSDGASRGGRRLLGSTGGHGAVGPGVRQFGHVPRLRRPGGRLRRGRTHWVRSDRVATVTPGRTGGTAGAKASRSTDHEDRRAPPREDRHLAQPPPGVCGCGCTRCWIVR